MKNEYHGNFMDENNILVLKSFDKSIKEKSKNNCF